MEMEKNLEGGGGEIQTKPFLLDPNMLSHSEFAGSAQQGMDSHTLDISCIATSSTLLTARKDWLTARKD